MKKINEVSRLTGVTKRTLQYYDNEGLINVQRSKDNYRLFDEEAVDTVKKILMYKEMGFELGEIKVMLYGTENDRRALVHVKMEWLQSKGEKIKNQLEFLRKLEKEGTLDGNIKSIY